MRRSFTLVETLVTAGVVTVLLGLLLTTIGSVRATGRGVVCLSNLRQMAVAAQQYALESGAWPAAIRYDRSRGEMHQVAWDWVTTLDGRLVEPGPLWTYTDDPGRVMQCPDYTGTTNFEGDPFTGYNYNTTYIGGEARFPGGWSALRRGVAPHECRRGSTCALFGDGGRGGGGIGGTNKFMRAPLGSDGTLDQTYAGGQAFRHAHATTSVAYVDGHVSSVNRPQAGRHATEELLSELGYPENGFLSDDDSAYRPR